MNKPIKPNITIPQSFAENGIKTDFDSDLLTDGFDNLRPDVLAGDNLNKFIDDTYKGLNYGIAAADAINSIQEGETLTVQNGQLVSGSTGGGLEICDIGMALYVDETKGLRRYLNGQIVDINTNTQAFLNRLLEIKNTNPDYFTTEDNWQSEALLNIDGCVYKFVLNYSGDNVVSVRLPKYPNYVEINAGGTLPVVGNGMTLGFTDGTNNTGLLEYTYGFASSSTNDYGGAVGQKTSSEIGGIDNYKLLGLTQDGAKSGIQTTLKQTKLKMRYFIQIATGSETENNIINDIELNNPYSLFDSKYSDHELNNLSWLKSEGQWNAKAVYPTAYEALLVENNSEIQAGTTSTLPSGVSYTKQGLSVKLSTDEYTDYDFVLNTADETFRLPLLDGSEDLVGDEKIQQTFESSGSRYIAPKNGWYMHYGVFSTTAGYVLLKNTTSGIISQSYGGSNINSHVFVPVKKGDTVDASYAYTTSNTLYFAPSVGNGTLYYYVGETVQNANLIDAGRIGEQLASVIQNNKHTITDYCMPDYSNMTDISIEIASAVYTFTAPCNGVMYALGFISNSLNSGYVKVNGSNILGTYNKGSANYNGTFSAPVLLSKGDVVKAMSLITDGACYLRFAPLKGEA